MVFHIALQRTCIRRFALNVSRMMNVVIGRRPRAKNKEMETQAIGSGVESGLSKS